MPAMMVIFMARAVIVVDEKCRRRSESIQPTIQWTNTEGGKKEKKKKKAQSLKMCAYGWRGQQTVYLSSKQESVIRGLVGTEDGSRLTFPRWPVALKPAENPVLVHPCYHIDSVSGDRRPGVYVLVNLNISSSIQAPSSFFKCCRTLPLICYAHLQRAVRCFFLHTWQGKARQIYLYSTISCTRQFKVLYRKHWKH